MHAGRDGLQQHELNQVQGHSQRIAADHPDRRAPDRDHLRRRDGERLGGRVHGPDPGLRRPVTGGADRAPGSGSAQFLRPVVAEEVARSGSERRGGVVGVVDPTGPQRQAAAPDAGVEVVAEAHQRNAIWSSSRGRHDADRRAQSAFEGVRPSGSDAMASLISSRLRPTVWAIRMNETRRRASRVGRRAGPRGSVRRGPGPRARSSGVRTPTHPCAAPPDRS